jgi:hypothetical protein
VPNRPAMCGISMDMIVASIAVTGRAAITAARTN